MNSSAWGLAGGVLLGAGQLAGSFPCWVPRLRLGHPLLVALPVIAALGIKAADTVANAIDKIEQVVEKQNKIIAASEEKDEAVAVADEAAPPLEEDEGAEVESHENPAPDSTQEPARLGQPNDIADQLEESDEGAAGAAGDSNGEAVATPEDETQPSVAPPDSNANDLDSKEVACTDSLDLYDGLEGQQARSSAIQREVTGLLDLLERECNSPSAAAPGEPTQPQQLQGEQAVDDFDLPMQEAAVSEGEAEEEEAEAPQQEQEPCAAPMDVDEIEDYAKLAAQFPMSGDEEPSAEDLAAEAELEEEERLIDEAEASPLSALLPNSRSEQQAPTAEAEGLAAATTSPAATATATTLAAQAKKKKHLSRDQKQAQMHCPPARSRKAKIRRAQLSKQSRILRDKTRQEQTATLLLVDSSPAANQSPSSRTPSKRKRQVVLTMRVS